ncbi:MAG: type IV pilus secretin family protein [Deltaproteobacteria bacterium]|nr:MAG: type IV pilus secretin family protein [Deltaproteobacteria bacterium]
MRHAIEFDGQTARQWRPPRLGARALFALAAAAATLPVVAADRASTRAPAEAVNEVRRIEVAATKDGIELRLHGSREATYTAFKLAQPPRLVVDLSNSDVSALRRLTEVGRGNVRAVLTTQFDDADRKVGRVMVVLERDAPYAVRSDGRTVIIHVRGNGAADGPLAESHGAEEQTGEEERMATAAEAVTHTGSGPAEPATEPAETVAEAKPSREGVGGQEALPPGVVARRVDRLETPGREGHRVLAVSAERRGDRVRIRMATDGDPEVVEVLELVDPPRLAIDLHGMREAPRRADSRRLDGRIVTGVRIGRHADKVRVVVDGPKGADRMAPYALRRTPAGVDVVVGPAVRPAPAVARATEGRGETRRPSQQRKARRRAHAAKIRAISYARTGAVGRVVLAVEGETDLPYEVTRPDTRTAVLTLRGATIDSDLERSYDASAYGGEVQAVTAYAEPGAQDTVKIVATLARPVKNRVVPMAGGLSWEFQLSRAPAPPALAQNEGKVSPLHAARAERGEASERTATESVVTARLGAAGLATEGAVHVTTSGERQRPRYRGKRINLDLKEMDIHNVLRLIAEVSKRNIVVSDDVKGTVTLRLRNVPWDQALDIVLRSKGLDKEVVGNIIRIAPADVLEKEREQRVKAMEAKKELEPLRVRLIPVNFATASDMKGKVEGVLTDRGSVTVDARTNSLIVKDVLEALSRAEQLVRRLDSETPQVLIESRIIEANTNFSRQIGVQWGGGFGFSPAAGNPTGLAFPNTLVVGGAADDPNSPTAGLAGLTPTPNFAVNMPAPIGLNSGGGIGFSLGSIGGTATLYLRLSALENEGVIKTISAPKVTTLDNAKATISQGLSIPFSQVSAAGVNTTFVQAQLKLDVTPHVTADGSILMDVSVTNNQPNPQLTGANGQPSISQKEAKTNVMVKDGETTVIGGIYTRQSSESMNAVPGLSKIPILGWLFKKKTVSDQRTELLVFITPRIINRASALPGGAQ